MEIKEKIVDFCDNFFVFGRIAMRPVLIESSGDSATPKYQVFCLTPSDGRDTTGRSMEVEAKWCPGQLQNHPKSPNSQCSNLEEAVMDTDGAEGCHRLLRDTHGF